MKISPNESRLGYLENLSQLTSKIRTPKIDVDHIPWTPISAHSSPVLTNDSQVTKLWKGACIALRHGRLVAYSGAHSMAFHTMLLRQHDLIVIPPVKRLQCAPLNLGSTDHDPKVEASLTRKNRTHAVYKFKARM